MNINNGSYPGRWGGYVVTVDVNGDRVKLNTQSGVRGINIPVVCIYTNGTWTVTHQGRNITLDLKVL